jgi:prepilin-type N-terminal cleavage/methylation domain-containing protein
MIQEIKAKKINVLKREAANFFGMKFFVSRFSRAASQSTVKGFTLLELLVSIAIFTFITGLAIYNNNQFNSSVLLTNLAYEVGLSIRQAQFYGIVVRQTSADTNKFNSGYGVHFDTGTPSSYILFEDIDPANRIYDAGDVILETFNIQKGNKITRICVDSVCTENIIDISFIRPNPDAHIRVAGGTVDMRKAEVCVVSPPGTIRKVVVELTGQISVVPDTTNICRN